MLLADYAGTGYSPVTPVMPDGPRCRCRGRVTGRGKERADGTARGTAHQERAGRCQGQGRPDGADVGSPTRPRRRGEAAARKGRQSGRARPTGLDRLRTGGDVGRAGPGRGARGSPARSAAAPAARAGVVAREPLDLVLSTAGAAS